MSIIFLRNDQVLARNQYNPDDTIIRENPNTTTYKVIGAYTTKGGGVYDCLGAVQKVFEGVVLCATKILSPERIADLTKVADSISSCRSWLIITKISSYTSQKFSKSFWKIYDGFTSNKFYTFIYDSLDLALDFMTFGFLFRMTKTTKFVLGRISNLGSLVLYSWDFKKAVTKIGDLGSQEQDVHPPLLHINEKNTFLKESKRHNIIKLALSITNIVKDFFVFIAVWGFELSSVYLWCFGTTALILRVSKDVYAASMTYVKEKDINPSDL